MHETVLQRLRSHLATAGQAIVEFALAATLIFFLLAAAIDLGLIFFTLQGLNNAAQEGAAYGARWLAIQEDDTQANFGSQIVHQNEIRNRVRFESGTEGGINFVNLHDLDNDDVLDVTDDAGQLIRLGLDEAQVTYSIDTTPEGTNVYAEYIEIQLLGYDDLDGDDTPELFSDDACLDQTVQTGRRHPCFLQVTVSYEYDLVFGLAPAFGDRVRLSQSHTERIVDPLEKLGEQIPGYEPEFWTATATNTPTPTDTPTITPSPSASPTEGPSPTNTTTPAIITSTPTQTHTEGPSPTPTLTHTEGPSPTPTDTPTNTPTPTPTPSLFIAWVDPYEERNDPEDVVYWAEGDVKDVETVDDTYFRVVAYGFSAQDDLSGMTEHEKDGTNIDRVEFEIRGPADDRGAGEQILWRADGSSWGPEGTEAFCVFSGNTPCNRLDQADSGKISDWRSFFDGPGEYTLRSRAYSDNNMRTQWVERKINVLPADDMLVWITDLDGNLLDEDLSDQTVPEMDTQNQTGFRAVAYRKDGDSTDYNEGRDGTDVDRVEVEILRAGDYSVQAVQDGNYPGTSRFFPRREEGAADYHFFPTDDHLMDDFDFSRLNTGIYILRARTLGSNSFLWSEWTETLVRVPPIELYLEFINPVPPSSNPRDPNNPDLATAIEETQVISTIQDTRFQAIAYDLAEYDAADTLAQRIAKDGTNISEVQFEINAPQDFPFRNAVTDYMNSYCTEGPTGADIETPSETRDYSCWSMSLNAFERLNIINGIYTIRARAKLEGGNRWSDWYSTYFNVPADEPCQDGTTPLPIALASGWTADDIGYTADPGFSEFSGDPANDVPGSAQICASGENIYNNSDDFHYVYSETTAELKSIAARMNWFQGSGHRYTRTGLMMRGSSAANSAFAIIYFMPNENGGAGRIGMHYRTNDGNNTSGTGNDTGIPTWLKLERSGDMVLGYYSFDTTADASAVNWTLINDVEVNLGSEFLAGVAATARDNESIVRASYSDIQFEYIEACSTTPNSGVNDGSGWVETKIGTVSDSTAQFTGDPLSGTPGAVDICTTGDSIWGGNDNMQYVYTESDGMFKEVTARLNSWSGSPETNAKTGLMVRSSAAEDASYFMVRVKIGGNVATQYRTANDNNTGGGTAHVQSYPTWLRIVKAAGSDRFTGYYSLDTTTDVNAVNWTELETRTISDFGDTYLVGAASSGYTNVDFTRAEYSQIEMDFYDACDITCCPENTVGVDDGSGWQTAKIGDESASTPLEVQRTGDTFDMCYIGGNIWNRNNDHFPFTYQEINVNDFDQITVRLDDVYGSGHQWARLGPMVRDSLDQRSAHYMVRYLPNQGDADAEAQWRPEYNNDAEEGGRTSRDLPQYLRIEKADFRSSDNRLRLQWRYSNDGVNWSNRIDREAIYLEDETLLVGLATTSRDGATESWATFSNVTIE